MPSTSLWLHHGDLLRWWRVEVANLAQQAMADLLDVSRTTVTNWEANSRVMSLAPADLDVALGAGGSLMHLLWSLGAPDGLDASQTWTHVYRGSSTPVWMWIRSPEPEIEVEVKWGLYRLKFTTEVPPNGVFVAVGASVDQSPIVAMLSEPGWIEFGRGELPPDIPAAKILEAVDLMEPSSANGGTFQALLAQSLCAATTVDSKDGLADWHPSLRESVVGFLRNLRKEATPHTPETTLLPEGIDHIEPGSFERLRKARNLSLIDTVTLLRERTGLKLSKDTLRRFETGASPPQDPMLVPALDAVLGGSGKLALTVMTTGVGSGVVEMPAWWEGPVWVKFEHFDHRLAPDRLADLVWDGWVRTLRCASGEPLVLHGSPRRLQINTGPQTTWSAGLGRPQGATPYDDEWLPNNIETVKTALHDYREVFLQALRARDAAG